MYGVDCYAIKVGKTIYVEERGGMYIIALDVYHPRNVSKLVTTLRKDYKEEVSRLFNKIGKWVSYTTIREYSEKGKGDCLFYFTPSRSYLVGRSGKLKSLTKYIQDSWKRLDEPLFSSRIIPLQSSLPHLHLIISSLQTYHQLIYPL